MDEKLKEIIDAAENIVFFGGAGVSTESGIPDFRSTDGLYAEKYKYPPEEILSLNFFMNNTEEFFDFYKKKMIYLDAEPNKAHYALAELEKSGKLRAVVTQNIDGLHQAAGSSIVLELHGSVHRNYCQECRKEFNVEAVIKSSGIPKCGCGGIIKPDVVLYGENLDKSIMMSAVGYISKADVLIIGGTSLGVYPAAGLIRYFEGSSLVLINKSETPMDSKADLVLHQNIGEALSFS